MKFVFVRVSVSLFFLGGGGGEGFVKSEAY